MNIKTTTIIVPDFNDDEAAKEMRGGKYIADAMALLAKDLVSAANEIATRSKPGDPDHKEISLAWAEKQRNMLMAMSPEELQDCQRNLRALLDTAQGMLLATRIAEMGVKMKAMAKAEGVELDADTWGKSMRGPNDVRPEPC